MPVSEREAIGLVMQLSRMRNFPTDEPGLKGLARGLQHAADETGADPRKIVEECQRVSQWCPTDFDLLAVARDLAPADPPPPWAPDFRRCPRGKCDGHGWEQVFWLVSWDSRASSNFTHRERISEERYRELSGKVDHKTQEVYESTRRCACARAMEVPSGE